MKSFKSCHFAEYGRFHTYTRHSFPPPPDCRLELDLSSCDGYGAKRRFSRLKSLSYPPPLRRRSLSSWSLSLLPSLSFLESWSTGESSRRAELEYKASSRSAIFSCLDAWLCNHASCGILFARR